MDIPKIYEEVIRGPKTGKYQDPERVMEILYEKARRKAIKISQTSDTPHPLLFSPQIEILKSEEHMKIAHQRGLFMEQYVRGLYTESTSS